MCIKLHFAFLLVFNIQPLNNIYYKLTSCSEAANILHISDGSLLFPNSLKTHSIVKL